MSAPAVIKREPLLVQLRQTRVWDVIVIGGGATGLGIAVDAAQRGFSTALIEARDFASGTSSRSTKLIHGGVRYLAQGNVKLVREALSERALLLTNAPALVKPLKLIVPCYRTLEREFLRVGLGVYDALAGSRGIGDTRWLSRAETIAQLPGVRAHGLLGGVAYWDAQFNDARLAIALMRTAARQSAVVVNYIEVDRIELDAGTVSALMARDVQTGERFRLCAKVVFNATGVWADEVRRRAHGAALSLTTISRGSHIVVPASFMPGASGMMIPRTSDGRVLFAIPWEHYLMVGTTDVAAPGPTWQPEASAAEIEYIIDTARDYLQSPISRGDVLTTFAGLRPLFSPTAAKATKTISREHAIVIEHGNLVTVVGGKWTTYRKMALDALDQAVKVGLLDARPCRTAGLKLEVDDSIETACHEAETAAFAGEGTDSITEFVALAINHEQAHYADDVIARRLRVASLSDYAASRVRPIVSAALEAAKKKGHSNEWP